MSERKPKVFVIQVPARRDGPRGGWVEKYDLSPAERFGELVRVLPYGNVPMDPEPTRSRLYEAFESFDFDHDSVLLLGDPVAIAQAVDVLAAKREISCQYGHRHTLRALKWDRREEAYALYHVG